MNNKNLFFNKSETIKILSIGNLNITYILNLTDNDIKKYNIDFNSIQIHDLDFLLNDSSIWNRIIFSSEDSILNTLIFLNKSLSEKNKIFIEYISISMPNFKENEKNIKNFFELINNINYIFINNQTLFPTKNGIFKIKLNYNDYSKIFEFGNDNNYNNNDLKISIKNKNNENNLFKQIILNSKNYNYFICELDDILNLNKINEFLIFIKDLKSNHNCNIIFFYSDMTNIFNSKSETNSINELLLLTDIFIMNINDAVKNFNEHNKIYSIKENIHKEMTTKSCLKYFVNSICCKGELSLIFPKMGLFLDDNFTKITIIEVLSNKKEISLNYEINPFPQINHKNTEIIENYKDVFKKKFEFFKSIYFAGFFSKICLKGNKKLNQEIIYLGHKTGNELSKRILEVIGKNLELPINPNFYIIKLDNKQIEKFLEKFNILKREKHFILDCTNVEKSSIKEYVPLIDYNLHGYFGNKLVRKELYEKGFINENNYVNYDPLYRKSMGIDKKKLFKSRSSLNENEIIMKKINIQNEELNNKKILKNASPTKIKLPFIQCEILKKGDIKKKTNKKIKLKKKS